MTFVSPASNYDIACCLGQCQTITWQCLKAQRDVSQTWSLRNGKGEAVIVAGLWQRDDGSHEAWFIANKEAAHHLKCLIRFIRLTLRAKSYPEIEVRIATRAGARIAQLCGFQLLMIRRGVEIWRYVGDFRRK